MHSLRTGLKRTGFAVLGVCLALLLAVPGWAKAEWADTTRFIPPAIEGEPALDLGPTLVDPAPTAPGLGDPAEFEQFVDNFFAQVESDDVPGGVVAVVKDGEIFFAKGYGYADLDQQTPVDAETTLFRVASLSKIFTATAIMQLQEEGLLNLEDDIRNYLGDRVQLENPFPEPVTFAQMLTHTDGSTKRRIGLAADTEAKLQSLETYLADNLPPIVYPPGKLFSYSSHSIALLGYLVQEISGQPFVDYIDEHILQPLEMSRSSFAQPPPYFEDLATGYRQVGGQLQPVPYLYLNIGPAAALSATATDMAHFMIAHLQGGAYEDSQILPAEAIANMQEIHFRPHPELPGTGYGFRERRINGRDVIGHLGSLRGYSSSLTLINEEDVGIFIATNSFSGVHSQLLRQLFDRYFPTPPDPNAADPTPLDPAQLDLNRFTGLYRDLEYPRHTITQLTAPYQRIRISRTDTGLEIKPPALFFRTSRSPSQLEPIEPLLFRQTDGTLTAFEADASGNITYAYNPVFAKMATFTKIAWYEDILVHAGIVVVAVLLFLNSLWIWPIHPVIRRLRGKPFKLDRPAPIAWKLAGTTSGLNLIFLIGFPLCLWLYGGWKLAYGMPWFGTVFLVLPIITALLTLGMLGLSLWSWGQGWSAVQRIHYALLALGATLLMIVFAYWQILGFQY